MPNKKICFFLNTPDPTVIERSEFYKIDVLILKELGFDIQFSFNYKNIPTDAYFYFVWWWTYAFFPLMLAKITGRKLIITGTFNLSHHIAGNDFYSRPFLHRLLIKMSAKLCDANILVSKYELCRFKQQISRNNAYFSPHGLYLDKYLQRSKEKREAFIFTIAWMNRENALRKCIPEIIKSAYLLKNRGFSIPFLICGKIEKDALFLQDLVNDLQMNDLVKFLGLLSEEEKIKYLKKCSIYLQPTVFEGFGVAIAEALLCGTPTITSKVGAVSEVTGNFCSYVNGKNPAEIAEMIVKVLDNYESNTRIAGDGAAHIQNNFNYVRRKAEIRDILKKLNLIY